MIEVEDPPTCGGSSGAEVCCFPIVAAVRALHQRRHLGIDSVKGSVEWRDQTPGVHVAQGIGDSQRYLTAGAFASEDAARSKSTQGRRDCRELSVPGVLVVVEKLEIPEQILHVTACEAERRRCLLRQFGTAQGQRRLKVLLPSPEVTTPGLRVSRW